MHIETKPDPDLEPNDPAVTQDPPADADFADFDNPPASAKEAEEAAAAAAPAGGAADNEPDASADKGDNKELLAAIAGGDGFIPKARFDEATGRLKDQVTDLRQELDQVTARQSAALAPLGEARDFKAEKQALKDQYDNGDLDDDEYSEKREALVLEEAEFRALSRLALAQADAAQKAAEQAWTAQCNAWVEKHAEILAVDAIRNSVDAFLTRAQTDPELSKLSNDALLAKAEEHMNGEVQRLRSVLLGEKTPAADAGEATTAPAPANPHAGRDAKDAAAIASASAVPSPSSAGAGDRGRASFPGIRELADKDIANLPKDVTQAKTLADF